MSRTARLIPAEALGAASPWNFERMGAPVESAPVIRPEAVRDARAMGYAEGHAAGVAEATAQVQAEMQEAFERLMAEQAARFAALFDAAQTGLAQAQQDIARGSLEIACALARQVLRRELAHSSDGLIEVAHEAVQALLEDGRSATLHVSPDDHARLGEALEQALAQSQASQVSVVADATVANGGCLLESAAARIDASVAKRWERAVASLGLDAPWEPTHAA
ncbi:FliH/SctL family protein [Xenophilus arseniciresistens]|uniref:Flagellar assembly protein FliH n=1 Tax=Xenophilus arseniciresistens TaxID=1283306 RepID=A0AAE3N4U0_9BURK|nr:FliH/SctL family protein [Xenophilus arseniciresistens]MDA7415231.1 FliH/SctL family protein [Xenophilus arseniciresistens]